MSLQLHLRILTIVGAALVGMAFSAVSVSAEQMAPASAPSAQEEPRLRNVRQLTFGGENAEAYWSSDASQLIFQASPPGVGCDRIYRMNADGSDVAQVSSGAGATTCAYFHPSGQGVYYASTHLGGEACPPKPDRSQGYVWPIYPTYDVFLKNAEGEEAVRLTDAPGYDAEATVSPDGTMVVFTSVRDGDLDLYIMDADGSNQRRITSEPGYDGGAFFSPDSTRLVFRASRPEGEELQEYRRLLEQGLVRPGKLEIFTCKTDGSDLQQVTNNGAANFCPFFHPDGERIIFASNMHDPRGRRFDLFLINADGTGLEQVTHNESFDGFPMFSPDGTQLVWGSNRNNAKRGDTNIFVADWAEDQ